MVNIPKDHLDITIRGNFISKIANAFKGLFKGKIVDIIDSQLVNAIQDKLPDALNNLVSDQQGHSEIYNNMELDWSQPYAPRVTDQNLQFGIKGLFFQRDRPQVEP